MFRASVHVLLGDVTSAIHYMYNEFYVCMRSGRSGKLLGAVGTIPEVNPRSSLVLLGISINVFVWINAPD